MPHAAPFSLEESDLGIAGMVYSLGRSCFTPPVLEDWFLLVICRVTHLGKSEQLLPREEMLWIREHGQLSVQKARVRGKGETSSNGPEGRRYLCQQDWEEGVKN